VVTQPDFDSYLSRPKLLSLCCGVGGDSMGYSWAGFDVTGVDLNPQPDYPFRFHHADAIEFLIDHGREYDMVHAGFPCQGYSWATPRRRRGYYPINLIEQCREVCESYGLPLVMENVREARNKLHLMQQPTCDCYDPMECEHEMEYTRGWRQPLVLCGTMFGLRLLKHRLFDIGGMAVPRPAHHPHSGSVAAGDYVTVAGHGADNARGNYTVASWRAAMGIPWARTRHSLAEAIPPAYTHYIGAHALAWL
jgi:DNA (cytosine-5)-methyltransferase 1